MVLSAFQLPQEDSVLEQKLREESRAMFLQRRSRQLLDNNELKVCKTKILFA
jgi:serine/threonine-protein phosphatase 2A regulatory subunit B''